MSHLPGAAPVVTRRPRHRKVIAALAITAILEIATVSLSTVVLASSAAAGHGGRGPQAQIGTGLIIDARPAPADLEPVAVPWRRLDRRLEEFEAREALVTPAPAVVDAVEPAPEDPDDAAESAPAPATTAPATWAPAAATRPLSVVPRLRIGDLGIDQRIAQFPCDRAQPPDNFVYRWGCAGRNNLYLLGHAYSVFAPLHDAYTAGALHVGMAAAYTEPDGTVTTYRVTTWRLVRPDQGDWAIAAQPVPSMTLQTCYGANSEYRLLVRLVAG